MTCGDANYAGGTVLRRGYRITFKGDLDRTWKTVEAIGGRNGWYFAQSLWRLRGMMDRVAGGPGLGRGRRHSTELRVGDVLDLWRVVDHQPPHRLLLLAEMKAPGDALWECTLHSAGEGLVRLEMVSRFLPRGLAGLGYWYGLLPIHDWLFKGTLQQLVNRSGGMPLTDPEIFRVENAPQCHL